MIDQGPQNIANLLISGSNQSSYLAPQNNQLINGFTKLNMNNQRITGLQEPIDLQDCATKNYVNNTAISGNATQIRNATDNTSRVVANQYEITNGTTKLNMNSSKIINVGNATDILDAVNKQYVDSVVLGYIPTSIKLNEIPTPNGSVNMNNQKILNLQNATNDLEAINLQQLNNGLNTKYTNNTPLNSITIPIASVNMNTQKIINLATPSSTNDAVNKFYVDSALSGISVPQIQNQTISTSKLVAEQTELTNGSTPLNMNTQKIINIVNPTSNQDASTKLYTDTQDNLRYLNTTTLNNITLANDQLNMNTQKIINVIDPVNLQDVSTKNYVELSNPIGSIITFPGNKTNSSNLYLLCDGSTFSAVTYPALNTLLGSTTLPAMPNDMILEQQQYLQIYQGQPTATGNNISGITNWSTIFSQYQYLHIQISQVGVSTEYWAQYFKLSGIASNPNFIIEAFSQSSNIQRIVNIKTTTSTTVFDMDSKNLFFSIVTITAVKQVSTPSIRYYIKAL